MCKNMLFLISFVLVLGLVSNVSAGLVAHWAFDDGAGITAVDSSGNGHDGTLQGDPQWVAGMIGSGALSFDGSDGLVDVGHDESLSMTDELTITVWVKVSDLSTFYFLVCKQPSGTAGDTQTVTPTDSRSFQRDIRDCATTRAMTRLTGCTSASCLTPSSTSLWATSRRTDCGRKPCDHRGRYNRALARAAS